MRLFYDQLFIKCPETSVATEFHQDLPFWPIQSDTFTISAWIVLGDITPGHGCLSFIPGTHRLRGSASLLRSSSSLMEMIRISHLAKGSPCRWRQAATPSTRDMPHPTEQEIFA
jgi:ectoine hydroxylase-related dioxygenase (phytanoyl-CoA dioxygenase family)